MSNFFFSFILEKLEQQKKEEKNYFIFNYYPTFSWHPYNGSTFLE